MAENQNQQTDLTFPAGEFGLETLQAKQPLSPVSQAASKTAARRVLGAPGQVITELADPPVAAAPTLKPIGLPAGSLSTTEKERSRLISSMWEEVPEQLTDFEQVLTPPPGATDRAKRKAARKKKNPTAGAHKNKSILLKPKPGVMLPPIRIGKQRVQDWLTRVEGILSQEAIADAAIWYRSGKMLQPFMSEVGPADTPEIESGFLVGSQQKSPSSALLSYLRQREQARRGVKFDDRRRSGQQDAPLFQIAKGEKVTGGAGQKIYDFYDSAMQNPTRTFYANDPKAGKPFVVDVHSFRDMGYIDDTFKKFLEENYVIPKGFTLEVDQPVGAPSEPQYEAAADAGRRLTAELNKMGYGEKLGIGQLEPPDVQAIGWVALSKLYGAQAQDVPEAIERNLQRVSAELSFGEGAPYNEQFPEFANLPTEQQYRVTREAMAWIGDRANELAGTMNVGRVHGSGGWENYPPSPAMVETLLSTPEGADLYASIVGYLGQQTEVWAVKQVTTGSAAANGVAIDILEQDGDRITKGANLINAWNEINKFNPEVFQGYQPIVRDGKPGIRVIVPFKYSPFKSKQKLRDYVDENADALATAVDNVFPGDDNFTINPVDVNIRENQNDWTQNPNGQSHLQRISETGGQSLADSIRDSHRPEFEAFLANSLRLATSRTGGLSGIPDTKNFARAIPPRRRLVLPGQSGATVFGEEDFKDALLDYESAREIQNPILDPSKRQHNFDRWWNWDFEKDQAGKNPSIMTVGFVTENTVLPPEYSENNPDPDAPAVVYHGSPSFRGTKFDPKLKGARDHGYFGKGFYFTPDVKTAEMYTEQHGEPGAAQEILPVHLSIKDPFHYELIDQNDLKRIEKVIGQKIKPATMRRLVGRSRAGWNAELEQRIRNWADSKAMDPTELIQAAGFDSIIVQEEIIVFDPKQIKSATGNIGFFNPRSDDFLTQLEQPIKKRNQQMAQLQAPQIMRRRESAA
jgi:hypothetical protein